MKFITFKLTSSRPDERSLQPFVLVFTTFRFGSNKGKMLDVCFPFVAQSRQFSLHKLDHCPCGSSGVNKMTENSSDSPVQHVCSNSDQQKILLQNQWSISREIEALKNEPIGSLSYQEMVHCTESNSSSKIQTKAFCSLLGSGNCSETRRRWISKSSLNCRGVKVAPLEERGLESCKFRCC